MQLFNLSVSLSVCLSVCLLSICLSACLFCLSVCLCVTFVVFTDCESYTRPISINPGSMEAGEYGLTRGTCFVARRLVVVAVAGLLWISRCVSGAAGLFVFFRMFFFFERTRPAATMRPPCLIYVSTSMLKTVAVFCQRGGLLGGRLQAQHFLWSEASIGT